jgi:trans-aconitate methyltransferase
VTPDEIEAFFILHERLPRQGPGEPADVSWATAVARIPVDARICDAGCGQGADFDALLDAAPKGRVTGIEKHADFVETAAASGLDRVDVKQGDIAEITGPYDFIWAAGSLYFLGITEGLRLWRDALAPGGSVAFSEPCWLIPNPPHEARAFWRSYPPMSGLVGLETRIANAGWEPIATRVLSDTAWEAYYVPLEERLAELRKTASHPVWDEAEREIALWRRYSRAFGYVLSVVRPA